MWNRLEVPDVINVYKGYHHIQLAKEDEDKTIFHNEKGTYYYTKMLFGLRNVGATYQRMLDKVFEKQIGRNMEVYVYDMVIKSKEDEGLLKDIEEIMVRKMEANMKLNLKKCVFGV